MAAAGGVLGGGEGWRYAGHCPYLPATPQTQTTASACGGWIGRCGGKGGQYLCFVGGLKDGSELGGAVACWLLHVQAVLPLVCMVLSALRSHPDMCGTHTRGRPFPRVLLRRTSAHFKDYSRTPPGFGIVVRAWHVG